MNTAEIEELVSILEKDGGGYPLMQASAVALRQLLDERKWRPIETAEGMKSKGQQILAIMGPWKSILIAHRTPDMHAALLALARTELPCDAVAAGRNCAGASSETAQLSFIGICLTLAKQETTP